MAVQSSQEVSSYGYLWRDLDNAANHVRVIVVMKVPLRYIRGASVGEPRGPVSRQDPKPKKGFP